LIDALRVRLGNIQRSAGLWLGLWAMAWLLLLDWMVNAWPARHLPTESADAIAIPTTRLLGLPEAVSFPWLVVITGLVAGAIPGLLQRFMVLTRLDPQGWSEHCFWWATGGVIRFSLLMSLALLMGHWMLSAQSDFIDFDSLVEILGYLVLFGAPFFVWRKAVVAGDRPRDWWLPEWPGARSFSLFLAYLFLDFSLVIALVILMRESLHFALYFMIATGALVLLTLLLFPIAVIWLRGAQSGSALGYFSVLRDSVRLGAWLALHLRILIVVVLIIAPPILIGSVYVMYFLPELMLAIEQAGMAPAWWMSPLESIVQSWIVIVVPLEFYTYLAQGRLIEIMYSKSADDQSN